MGSMLETIKKGMSALNPIGSSTGKKTKKSKDDPSKSKLVNNSGYVGEAKDKIQSRKAALADAMKE